MILEIFKASLHSVGTATTMTAAGIYLHRRGMITSSTKTGMARYTQQIAIPALFFSRIVDCPQNFSQDQCPNILDHLGDAWILLIWPIYVLAVGLLVGYLMIRLVKPPKWQNNCVLASTAFANAMGMPITLLDVIGHNFVPPGNVNMSLSPSMFQSIYVILNPVLQWGLGGWLLSQDEEEDHGHDEQQHQTGTYQRGISTFVSIDQGFDKGKHKHNCESEGFRPLRREFLSIPSLEEAGTAYPSERTEMLTVPRVLSGGSFGMDAGTEDGFTSGESSEDESGSKDGSSSSSVGLDLEKDPQSEVYEYSVPLKSIKEQAKQQPEWLRVLKKIMSKAMQPPALGAMAGFVVASYSPLRGLFVDLQHRADNAPLEWVFDGVLALANSAIPVNMCVVGVNLDIASQRRRTSDKDDSVVHPRTIAAVVLGKMLIMPIIGIITVWIAKTYFWEVPESVQFQFYLVLMMNFITPTANVVMVIAEIGSGPKSKNVMASLIGWQYVVAPFLLSLTVMMVVWTAVL